MEINIKPKFSRDNIYGPKLEKILEKSKEFNAKEFHKQLVSALTFHQLETDNFLHETTLDEFLKWTETKTNFTKKEMKKLKQRQETLKEIEKTMGIRE